MKKFFKEHDLVKVVSIMLLLVIVLSWFIKAGSFTSGGTFTEGTIGRIGLSHIFYGFTFAIQNYSIQIAFLIMIGIFYGVVTHTEGYKAFVSRFAKFGKDKEIGIALVMSLIIAVCASFLNNTFILLAFMPLFVTVLRKMGFDKLSAFGTTFGSILVGVLGATYGTEGLTNFITYIGYGGSTATITTELGIRFGVLALAYILFSFFQVVYLKQLFGNTTTKKEVKEVKTSKKTSKTSKAKASTKVEEVVVAETVETDDKFAVDEPKKKNTKIWPTIVMIAVLFVFAVLGFLPWSSWNVTAFDSFHTWLTGLKIGDVAIFQTILGGTLTNESYELAPAFGSWYLFTYSVVLAIVTVIAALASKMSMNDFFANVGDGFKKLVRPTMYLILAYMVFVFLYWTPFISTIINAIGTWATGFNPFVATFQAIIGSIFNSDFAYLGYSLSYYLGSFTGNEGNIMFLIYTTIYGLAQFVTPISVFLLFGLSYMNIPYTSWMKYIWKFVVGMLVCLVIIFALLTYA